MEGKRTQARKRTLQLLATHMGPQGYFYCRFPLTNSIGQFILSATCGRDENCE